MREIERLKEHLLRLKSRGVKKSEFNVQFLLDAIENRPKEPIKNPPLPSKVVLDGGIFEDRRSED